MVVFFYFINHAIFRDLIVLYQTHIIYIHTVPFPAQSVVGDQYKCD